MGKRRVLVVGGGMSGLSAGIHSLLHGHEVTLLEKNKCLGGCMMGWRREGFYIDNCLHWLTGTRKDTALYHMWQTLGVLSPDSQIYFSPFLFRVEGKGKTLSLWQNPKRTESEMLALSPEDEKEIRRFFQALSFLAAKMPQKAGIEKVKQGLQAFLVSPLLLPYVRMTLGELSQKFRHPLLRSMMVGYIGEEFCALSLIYVYAAFVTGNASLCMGGTESVIRALEERFLSLGGRLETGVCVKELRHSAKRIECAESFEGKRYFADGYIAAIDPSVTFGRLLPSSFTPKGLREMYQKHLTYSAVQAAFRLKRAKDNPSGTVILQTEPFEVAGERQETLAFKVYDYDEVFCQGDEVVLQTLTFLREEGTVYFSRLSKSKALYQEEKAEYAALVKERLIKAYPCLYDRLSLLDVWTPATYSRYFDSKNGAFLGFATTPSALLYRLGCRIKPFENAFLATQWQKSPGGLPVAAQCGREAARVCSRFLS
ncbi:MAG: NAD(P)/FAD-dependent oxidoreductase [Clostridia bacterium]|nr:NAD(P)/FAD-dependent oxidoreductase [Clostridia bacterium]